MKKFNLTDRFRSIGHALEGLAYVLKTQHNAWIHLFMTILVILTGLYHQITQVNWMLLSVAIFSVWVAEVFNTALEILCDIVKPEIHPAVKKLRILQLVRCC